MRNVSVSFRSSFNTTRWRALVFSLLAALGLTAATANAQSVIVVADEGDIDGYTAFITDLYGEEVTVEATPRRYWELDDAKRAELEAADLIVVSRDTESGEYDDDGEVTFWNGLATPILLTNPYLLRDHRWSWHDSTSNPGTASNRRDNQFWDVAAPDDPILEGVTVTDGSAAVFSVPMEIDSNNETDGGYLGQTLFDISGSTTRGSVIRWTAGQRFHPRGTEAGGPRVYFQLPSTEEQNPFGSDGLTADGRRLLRNAMADLYTSPALLLPRINEFSATPESIIAGSSTTLTFDVEQAESIVVEPGVGAVSGPRGSIELTPDSTGTYTLTATNTEGEATASVTVAVIDADAPMISEFMAVNSETLSDSTGGFPDWIEIHNPNAFPIDMGGWFLTDNSEDLEHWEFPRETIIEANGYLVIFASGDETDFDDDTPHANFGLQGLGEYLALVRPDGETVQTEFAPFPEQHTDVSYGLDDNLEYGFFLNPTPGQTNGSSTRGFVADTTFSVDRGFFDQPFTLVITTATPGATIQYTTDGSEPSLFASTKVPAPDDNTPPEAEILIDKTTVIRVQAVKNGFETTNIDTQTYIFPDDVVQQPSQPAGFPGNWGGATADYEMDPEIRQDYGDRLIEALTAVPTLSVVLPTSSMFGSNGIYSNSEKGGFAWERECSAELIVPEGIDLDEFQENCGIRVQGGASRIPSRSPKHSFSLRFRSEYGDGRLDLPGLFGDAPVNSWDSLQLRAMYNNSWIHNNPGQRQRATMIRDQWARDSMIDMGNPDGGRGRYMHLYINGIYWGLHNVHERQVAAHYGDYNGGEEQELDALNGGSVSDGSITAYNEMRNIVNSQDWDRIQEVLDVDNYIDFIIMEWFADNDDLKLDGNWRAAGGGPDRRKWRFYSWDTERILENPSDTNLAVVDDPVRILDTLDNIEEFRVRFGDRVQKHLFNGGALTPERNIARFQARVQEIDQAIIAESARWGDHRRSHNAYERDEEWITEVERIVEDHLPIRNGYALNLFERENLYPRVNPPDVEPYGGKLPVGGEVEISTSLFSSGEAYYTLDGTDPRLEGGSISPSAVKVDGASTTIELQESATIKIRVKNGNGWSALLDPSYIVGNPAAADNIIVSEIHYRPAQPTAAEDVFGTLQRADFEFIELMNISSEAVELGGARFAEGLDFVFEPGTPFTIPPGGRALIVSNREAFSLRYPSVDTAIIFGEFANGTQLSNDGERISLLAENGLAVFDFVYNDAPPWPQSPDGEGQSLTLADPLSSPDLNDPASWRASFAPHGTPGTDEEAGGFDAFAAALGLTGEDAAPMADPDGDGVTNLVAYALGLDLIGRASATGLPRIDASGEHLTLSYRRRLDAPDVSYTVEVAETFGAWSSNGSGPMVTEEVSRVDNGDGTETVTVRTAATVDSTAEMFMRLKLSL